MLKAKPAGRVLSQASLHAGFLDGKSAPGVVASAYKERWLRYYMRVIREAAGEGHLHAVRPMGPIPL
jgi:hypothetical protein